MAAFAIARTLLNLLESLIAEAFAIADASLSVVEKVSSAATEPRIETPLIWTAP